MHVKVAQCIKMKRIEKVIICLINIELIMIFLRVAKIYKIHIAFLKEYILSV